MRWRIADEQGVTLVEMLVTCAVLMALLLPMLRFFDGAVGGAAELQTSTRRHSEARAALDQLVRELRQAYTGDETLAPVAVPNAQRLELHSPTAETPFRLRRISYELVGDELVRTVTWSSDTDGPPWDLPTGDGPAAPVMEAETVTFTPSLVDGEVQAVGITVTAPNSKGRADRTFETTVSLRNVA